MRGKVAAGAVAAALVAVATGAGAVVLVRSGEALPGTSVEGIDVGGQGRAGVTAAVRALSDDRTTGTLPVTAADVSAPVQRSLAAVDVDATVEQAMTAGREGPVGAVVGPLLADVLPDDDREVELSLDVDEQGVQDRLAEVAGAVDREPFPGGFTVEGTTVTPQPPLEGLSLDREQSLEEVADALRQGREEPLDLPVDEPAPPTTPRDVERVAGQATAALAAPFELTGAGTALRLSPEELAPLLSSAMVGGELALRVDEEALQGLVAAKSQAIDRPARRAGFEPTAPPPVVDAQGDLTWTPRPAQVSVRPSTPGLAVDVPAATAALSEAVLTGDHAPRPLPATPTASSLTTEQAQAAGVQTLLGTFTTYFTAGQPRATNIRRIAELVDDAYIPPGGTLSLNETAGQRTRAKGFVADGAIVDGVLTDEVGGGVSQFATTLFNAAFFAGLPIPEHKPHSFYISRYPVGRESTVYYGAIDVKVRNDTDSGISVQTSSTPSSVTVALYGDNGGRRVSATTGAREPREDGGFRISVTRDISGGDGRGERRVFRTTYDPVPPD